MSEKLCLKWNDFQENVAAALGNLKGDKDFSDVTLACEDGQQFEAHKVILVASSPFFHHLLKINRHAHPLHYDYVIMGNGNYEFFTFKVILKGIVTF